MRKWMLSALVLTQATMALAVEVGDTRASVVAELGQPIGELDFGERVRLMFPAGDVNLTNGKVESHTLKTEEQLARHEAIREQIVAQRAERAAAMLVERIDRGRAWLDYLKLESTAITDADVKSILAHWTKIRADYPEADIDAEYEATLALAKERAVEIKERREEQRIAALERRVEQAEQRATAAEQNVYEAQYTTTTPYYPAYYYPQQRPIVVVTNGVATCYPRPPYNKPYQPGLSAQFSNDNFSVSYNSGSRANYTNSVRTTTVRAPVVITHSGQ